MLRSTFSRGFSSAASPQSYGDVREAVRSLCKQYPGEYWRAKDRERAYPSEFVDDLTKQGYLSALIPTEYGGQGLPIAAACAILEEIQRSGSNGSGCHAQMYTMGTLLRFGNEEQKRAFLPKIATGELRLQAFGVTEPTSGSNTLNLRTFAQRSEDGSKYTVNGQKVWTSRAQYSDLMLLLARTTPVDQVKKRTDGLSVFLVDMKHALGHGMSIRPIRTMINHSTTEVFFEDVPVPASGLIGKGMNAERILIASECIGDARFFLDKAIAYANDRTVFNRKIGANQGVQFPLAKAYAQTQAAALMVDRAAQLYDGKQDCAEEANTAKYLAAEASWAAGEACMQTFGGFAFAEEYDIERKWRETRLYQIAPISTNLVLSYLSEHVLGLPRSY